MKKLLIMLILTTSLFANTLHPNIKVKYMLEKGKKISDFYLNDWIDVEDSQIRFKKTKQYSSGEDVIEMYIWDSYDQSETNISYFDKDIEILSVFFEDITGDSVRELFLITRMNNKYHIISYTLNYYRASYYFEDNMEFNKYLNDKFEDYVGELTASLVREEVAGKLLVDYTSYSLDGEKFYKSGEGIAYLKDTNTKENEYYSSWNTYIELGEYEEIDRIDEAHIYIKSYEDNIFAVFVKSDSGFELRELFEGRKVEELPFVVKDGRYKRKSNDFIMSGFYKNNKKDGYWEEYRHLSSEIGKYENGYREGEWIEENVQGKFRGLYKMGVKDGVWVEEYSGEKLIYKEGVQVE